MISKTVYKGILIMQVHKYDFKIKTCLISFLTIPFDIKGL